MAAIWIWISCALLLCLCSSAWSAPSMEDERKFDELERTLKELATSVLFMSGAVGGAAAGAGAGADTSADNIIDMDDLGSEAAASLVKLAGLKI